ncbi:MAG: 3-hydroxyacyl-CoA dehydrogenase NAD-binding domain-containing protein, partial [Myxococcota bacterium]
MKNIGIIGTGTMGGGIAQIASQLRCDVLFQNRKQDSVDKGLSRIQKGLDKLVSRDKLTQAQAEGTMGRIRGVVPLEDLKDCDLVIESAPEELEVKQDLLERVSGIVSDDCIIATNTSSLSITKLASFVSGPARFIGMHFFNPVPAMKLVEVVRGL